MKEFDFHAYHRKWNECWGVFEDETGQRFVDKISGIDGWDTNGKLLAFGSLLLRKTRVFLEEGDEDKTYPVIKTHYHEVSSGVYPYLSKPGFIVLNRHHNKTFLVGVRFGSTHDVNSYLSSFNGLNEVDLFSKKLPKSRLTNAPSGWLSKKVFWTEGKLFYLNTCIGFVKHEKLIKLTDEIYTPFIKPLVGEECQIKPL